MPPRELIERTRLFALAVLNFCRRLPETDEAREASRQLRRAATSVRSNYRAARIQHDPLLLQEAQELAKIFAKAVKTSRLNTAKIKQSK